MRLGDLDALEKSMRKSINERYISWSKTITVADIATLIFDEIDNAPTVEVPNYAMGYQDGVRKVLKEVAEGKHRPEGECANCDYRKFTETVVEGFVDVMNKNGITSVEQLSEMLKGGAE